ncbi:hypothetical protein, partial [Streptomyces rubiginosohelvolus]
PGPQQASPDIPGDLQRRISERHRISCDTTYIDVPAFGTGHFSQKDSSKWATLRLPPLRGIYR